MSNFLAQLLGTAPAPPAPVPAAQTYSPALERAARAKGFKSANEYVLWTKQRQAPAGQTLTAGQRPSLDAAFAWHPKNTLEYVTRLMGGN